MTMALEAVYEQDFLDCSYGFRPKRSVHQALQTLWKGAMDMDVGAGCSGGGHQEVLRTPWTTPIPSDPRPAGA
ncbi:MAG: hypothetical protein M9894_25160 [Planctomycetes bacterium]|nr:hypothetical protein [Planctomycetota bacterium]